MPGSPRASAQRWTDMWTPEMQEVLDAINKSREAMGQIEKLPKEKRLAALYTPEYLALEAELDRLIPAGKAVD